MKHLFTMLYLISLSACVMERAADKYPSNLTEDEITKVLATVPVMEPGKGQLCVLNQFVPITSKDSTCFNDFSEDRLELWGKDIVLDDQKFVKLQRGEYLCKSIEPGSHKVNVKKKNKTWGIDVDTSYKFQLTENEVLFLEEHYNEYIPLQSKNLNHVLKNLCITETEQKTYCEEDNYDKTKFCYSPHL